MAESVDTDRILFDACSSLPSRKIYVCAWAKIVNCSSDSLFIEDIDWTDILLGHWDDEKTLKEELQNIEPKNWEVTKPGCYIMRGLFDLKRDGDGYRTWDYLEEKIIEFDFMCTVEEHERPETGFEDLDLESNIFNL